MSASPQSFHRPPQDQEILGDLLHSLSQPLTSLWCSLELSIDTFDGPSQESVSAALQQAERVIGLVKLMREYLDADVMGPWVQPVAMAPVLLAVVEELSTVAAVRQLRLELRGESNVALAVAEPRLRLALQYLIGVLIEAQAPNGQITLQLEDGPLESTLRALVESADCRPARVEPKRDPVAATLGRVKLAIAGRVFEAAGGSLAFSEADESRFVLLVPRQQGIGLLRP